ncbi:hypothetical protein D3C73_761230 [compost metagenome]
MECINKRKNIHTTISAKNTIFVLQDNAIVTIVVDIVGSRDVRKLMLLIYGKNHLSRISIVAVRNGNDVLDQILVV